MYECVCASVCIYAYAYLCVPLCYALYNCLVEDGLEQQQQQQQQSAPLLPACLSVAASVAPGCPSLQLEQIRPGRATTTASRAPQPGALARRGGRRQGEGGMGQCHRRAQRWSLPLGVGLGGWGVGWCGMVLVEGSGSGKRRGLCLGSGGGGGVVLRVHWKSSHSKRSRETHTHTPTHTHTHTHTLKALPVCPPGLLCQCSPQGWGVCVCVCVVGCTGGFWAEQTPQRQRAVIGCWPHRLITRRAHTHTLPGHPLSLSLSLPSSIALIGCLPVCGSLPK